MWTVETYRKETGDTIKATNFASAEEAQAFINTYRNSVSSLMGIRLVEPKPPGDPYKVVVTRKGPKLKTRRPWDDGPEIA